jgi:ribulose bisphosphate carboxylase small subunit
MTTTKNKKISQLEYIKNTTFIIIQGNKISIEIKQKEKERLAFQHYGITKNNKHKPRQLLKIVNAKTSTTETELENEEPEDEVRVFGEGYCTPKEYQKAKVEYAKLPFYEKVFTSPMKIAYKTTKLKPNS